MSEYKKYALYKRTRGDSYKSILEYLKSKNLSNDIIADIISEVEKDEHERNKKDEEINDTFNIFKESPEEIEAKIKSKTELKNLENKIFVKGFRNYSIIGFLFLAFGTFLHIKFINESRSINSLISLGLIGIGWGIFFNSLFKHRKLKSLKGFVLPLSLAFILITRMGMSYVIYGDDIKGLIKDLDKNSSSVYTIVTNKEYQTGFRRKSQKVNAAWIYHYKIKIENQEYTGATSSPYEIYEAGDSIKVLYNERNPSINKIDFDEVE